MNEVKITKKNEKKSFMSRVSFWEFPREPLFYEKFVDNAQTLVYVLTRYILEYWMLSIFSGLSTISEEN